MRIRYLAIPFGVAMAAACNKAPSEAPAPSSTDISENASSPVETDMNAVDTETQASPSDSDVPVPDYTGKKRPKTHGSH